jgi:hypothetical protein
MTKNLLISISDLHFEEEQTDALSPKDHFPRNIPAQAFRDLISDIRQLAQDEKVNHIDFILAGDIFDLLRTQCWFKGWLRPYVDSRKVDAELEAKLLWILDAIERDAGDALKEFRQLGESGVFKSGERDIPIALHYFPGNHDRLVDATPALRRRARALLGLPPSDESFDHRYSPKFPPLLIRHGHEYDAVNFGHVFGRGELISENLPPEFYAQPVLGDFVAVQVGAGLPFCFRAAHGDDKILADVDLKAIYARLLLFDDVRPQARLLDFLLDRPSARYLSHAYSRRDWRDWLWTQLQPPLRLLLDRILADSFKGPVLPFWLRAVLFTRFWRVFGIPFWLAKLMSWFYELPFRRYNPAESALREAVLHGDAPKFLISAGHTHFSQYAHIDVKWREGSEQRIEQFFVDTGTWRDIVLSSTTGESFSTQSEMTYLTVLWSEEKTPSFNIGQPALQLSRRDQARRRTA